VLRNAAVLVASALALGILALGGWRVSTKEERNRVARRTGYGAVLEDANSLRQIVGMIVERGELPMKDGALDPYDFVRTGTITDRQIHMLLRSRRMDKGPTKEEVLRGDYTNFPWERYRGERTDLGPPVYPLLWERESITDYRFVGFSDGSVKALDPDEFEERGLAR